MENQLTTISGITSTDNICNYLKVSKKFLNIINILQKWINQKFINKINNEIINVDTVI